LACTRVVAREQHREVARRLEQQLLSQSQSVVVERILVPQGRRLTVKRDGAVRIVVLDDGMESVEQHRGPAGDRIGESAAEGALESQLVVRAVGGVRKSRHLLRGLLRDELHQAAGRIAAEQRPLRTFQYLDTIKIVQPERLPLPEGDVALIHVHCDGRLGLVVEVVLGNTAHRKEGLLTSVVATDVHSGSQARDVVAVLEPEFAQLLARIGGDGDADILDGLLASLRGHRDFRQPGHGIVTVAVRGGGLRLAA